MPDTTLTTPLDRWIATWLAHQRALGRGYVGEQWILRHLQRFLASIGTDDLDQSGFDRWCDSFRCLSGTTRRGRQLVVRKLCLFRRRSEPDCFVPDPLYFVRLHPYRRPVILEPAHISRMLAIADNLIPTPNSPLLPAVTRLAVIILYTAGLRRGELARLTLDDVGPHAALRSYLHQRLAPPFDAAPSGALLCCGARGRHGYTGPGLGEVINRLFVAADVQDSEGRLPRVHDIRHSFAVQALMRCYRAGADVQSRLPVLAMYMGHVSIVSTAHYLHFVPTMQELASRRFEAVFGDVVPEVTP
jgi:integrase/recombinase XerD